VIEADPYPFLAEGAAAQTVAREARPDARARCDAVSTAEARRVTSYLLAKNCASVK
jgi:hypothetical protein